MRKVILSMHISLDGFVADRDNRIDWAFPQFTEAVMRHALASLSRIDTVLLGRVNYEAQANTWPQAPGPVAARMNAVEKVVFTGSPGPLSWSNSRRAEGTPAEVIGRLRTMPGGDIGVSGGPRMARAVIATGLVDELRLTVHPVTLGQGMPLFDRLDTYTLIDSRPIGQVIALTLRPAAPAPAAP